MPDNDPLKIFLPDAAATSALGVALAAELRAGDTLLLAGDIGAGKTHLARAIIQSRLAALDRIEDVPSPTFTLVQIYDAGAYEIWHADLYRLSSADDVVELGLDAAFETAVCLVEWPDRLDDLCPANALHLSLSPNNAGRDLTATGGRPALRDLLLSWKAHAHV